MATASASVIEKDARTTGTRKTLRFELMEKDTTFHDRITFGRRILFETLKIQPEEIYCLQQSTASKHYNVTFSTSERAEEVRRKCNAEEDEELRRYMVTPLYRNDYRILTIHMYNPWVTEETIRYFLGRYVTVLPRVRKIKDGLGIWTGKRQSWKWTQIARMATVTRPQYSPLVRIEASSFMQGSPRHAENVGAGDMRWKIATR